LPTFIKGETIVSPAKSISTKDKFVYFGIAKTGSASIEKSLSGQLKVPIHIHGLSVNFPEFSKYFMFSFVRNPYDRLVSCWRYLIRDPNCNNKDFDNGVFKKFLVHEGAFWKKMPFYDFVESVANIPDQEADTHFMSQYCFVCDRLKRPTLDFIGRFENLEEDFNKALSTIGLEPLTLPHINKTSKGKHYSEYYSDRSKELVAERYKEDIELFGYSFDGQE